WLTVWSRLLFQAEVGGREMLGERGDSRMVEQQAGRQYGTDQAAEPIAELQRRERIEAELLQWPAMIDRSGDRQQDRTFLGDVIAQRRAAARQGLVGRLKRCGLRRGRDRSVAHQGTQD